MNTEEALVEEVRWRGAIAGRSAAKDTIAVTLATLAQHLTPEVAATIAAQLPAALARALARPGSPAPETPGALYRRLADRADISLGLAVERARAACAALANGIDHEARVLLVRRLPPEWAELLETAPDAAQTDRPAGVVAGHGHTLATGKPGSLRPLAEAAAPAGRAKDRR